MILLKPLVTGLSAFGLILCLVLSFAPATPGETIALGPDPSRMALMQRRIAIGLRDVAPASVVGLLARAADISENDLLTALDRVIAPSGAMAHQAQAPDQPEPEPAPSRRIEAGGALFIQVN